MEEQPITFDCEGCRLVGIITQPPEPAETGVIIVVGGPQYRAGSHRQFTLLARYLADQGIASIRFDYRGMGDSEGEMRNFENVDNDIRTATETFLRYVPIVRHIAIWGLCDAASAALYYGHTDVRVRKLILLNPWVHTEVGASRARLKHYYLSRLTQRSFWAKLLSGKFEFRKSAGDLSKSAQNIAAASSRTASTPIDPRHGSPDYINRMLDGLKRFQGEVVIILSGKDLTAQEFVTLCEHDEQWKKTVKNRHYCQHVIDGANHTFSSKTLRESVARFTSEWLTKKTLRERG